MQLERDKQYVDSNGLIITIVYLDSTKALGLYKSNTFWYSLDGLSPGSGDDLIGEYKVPVIHSCDVVWLQRGNSSPFPIAYGSGYSSTLVNPISGYKEVHRQTVTYTEKD